MRRKYVRSRRSTRDAFAYCAALRRTTCRVAQRPTGARTLPSRPTTSSGPSISSSLPTARACAWTNRPSRLRTAFAVISVAMPRRICTPTSRRCVKCFSHATSMSSGIWTLCASSTRAIRTSTKPLRGISPNSTGRRTPCRRAGRSPKSTRARSRAAGLTTPIRPPPSATGCARAA